MTDHFISPDGPHKDIDSPSSATHRWTLRTGIVRGYSDPAEQRILLPLERLERDCFRPLVLEGTAYRVIRNLMSEPMSVEGITLAEKETCRWKFKYGPTKSFEAFVHSPGIRVRLEIIRRALWYAREQLKMMPDTRGDLGNRRDLLHARILRLV